MTTTSRIQSNIPSVRFCFLDRTELKYESNEGTRGGDNRSRVIWIVSWVWICWKQVWRSFSSDELRAWVRTVDREDEEGMIVVAVVVTRAD